MVLFILLFQKKCVLNEIKIDTATITVPMWLLFWMQTIRHSILKLTWYCTMNVKRPSLLHTWAATSIFVKEKKSNGSRLKYRIWQRGKCTDVETANKTLHIWKYFTHDNKHNLPNKSNRAQQSNRQWRQEQRLYDQNSFCP